MVDILTTIFFYYIIVPAAVYVFMEVCLDFTSHWSMGLAGAACFNVCRLLIDLPYIWFALVSSFIIMIIELAFGMVVNRSYKIWDYRDKKFNFKGQICLQFYFVWLVFMPPCIIFINNILPKINS